MQQGQEPHVLLDGKLEAVSIQRTIARFIVTTLLSLRKQYEQ